MRKKVIWLAGAFLFCFFSGGAIWWRGSYEEFMRADFRWETFFLLASVAMILTWGIGVGVLASGIVVAVVFPAIILTRVILDCAQDPTDHNLWPFEVVFATVFGLIMAFPAAGLGKLLRWLTHRGPSGSDSQPPNVADPSG